MMNNRFVLDTNIIISALLMPKSITRQAFEQALRTGKILQSTATIAELYTVIGRKKFDKYLTEKERQDFIQEASNSGRNYHSDACCDPMP